MEEESGALFEKRWIEGRGCLEEKKLNKEKEKGRGRGPLGDAGSPGLCAHMWQTSLQKSIPSSHRAPGFSQLVDLLEG